MSYHDKNIQNTPSVNYIDDKPSNNSLSSGATTFMTPKKHILEDALFEGRAFTPSFREFGRAEDYIELNIYNTNDDLVTHIRNFRDFQFTPEGINPQTGFSNEIILNPSNVLNDLQFNAGDFKLEYRFQRKKILNSFQKIFFIKEISNSRHEIRIESSELNNSQLEQRYKLFEQEIQESEYLKDFTLNFGNSINVLAINIALDKSGEKYSILIKLFEPLPSNLLVNSTFRIVEDLIQPTIYNSNVNTPFIEDGTIEILGPNYKIDTRLNSSIPSEFKTYDELLNGSISSSYQNLTNALSSSYELSIDYNNLTTDSNYHFENFTHFGSATEKLNNFKYKIKLIELYDSQITSINTITGDAASSTTVIGNKQNIESKKNKVVGGFDGYERFLYFESGTYSWPKSNSIKPYIQLSITSSEALTWLGSDLSNSSNYGGQLFSSSKFDNQNIYNLERIIPEYIKNNKDNDYYKLFVNMIGQHFDQSWLYIKSLTENKRAENHINKGIDKDLVYNTLKSLGIKVFDEFENTDLFEYITGINKNGSLFHTTGSGETLISSSNEGSLPKADITKEKWKRIYHNLPYFLKTKGTERGIRALITSYGIPSTVLNVKEFGGSTVDSTQYKTFSYDKASYALKGDSGTTGHFLRTNWSSSLTDTLSSSAKTIELRIKPYRSNDSYHLLGLSGSNSSYVYDTSLILEPYTGTNISSSGDSTQYGKLTLRNHNNTNSTSTNYFPIYNGDFWNIFVGIDVTGNSQGTSAQTQFGAYQTNHLKNVKHIITSSYADQTQNWANVWGLTFTNDTAAKRAGAQHVFVGGIPAGQADAAIDGLRYSGSLQELKYHFGELLSHATLIKHALNPPMYSGNTISSSYSNLVARLPLGGNLHKEYSQSFHPNYDVDYLNLKEGPELFINGTFTGVADTGSAVRSDGSQTEYGPLFSADAFNSSSIVNEKLRIEKQTGQSVGAQFKLAASNLYESSKTKFQLSAHVSGSGDIQELVTGKKITFTSVHPEAPIKADFEAINFNPVFSFTCTVNQSATFDNISVKAIPDISSSLFEQTFENIIETHHLSTPDTVGKSMTSEKVRIDTGEIKDNILSRDIKTETSTLDRQPLDTNDLGVYFSPSFEMNKDIINQLGSFRLDDYIGDPTHISENSYPDLKTLSNEYFKKNVDRYNYTDFIHSVKQFDHTLFKMIESMVPAKSNLKTGILIEPHYLERSKVGLKTTLPTVTQHTHDAILDLDSNSENSNLNLTAEYLSIEVNHNLDENYVNFDSTINPLLHNITSGRISKKYYIEVK